MSLSYVAAEYFIEEIRKSSTFCVSYSNVKTLINQADPVLASYFKEESKNDFLFIFKKFPDVFIFNGYSVSFTDAFLSLFAFPSSANFSTAHNCTNSFETAIIEYFKLKLSRFSTFHYTDLFNMLKNDDGQQQISGYFTGYTKRHMYSFFQTHSSIFTLLNDKVYLKINPSLEFKALNLKQEFSSKIFRKLKRCTYFLLTCFQSLHYIELKQCISFVTSPVKDFLNQHSLIYQREIFENKIVGTAMDDWGYVSLKDFSVEMPKSRKIRLILLIVCVLAFDKEWHFVKIVEVVRQRTSSDVSDLLCCLSMSEQFKFFKSFPDYFIMGGNGYVSLVPAFVFPLCSFQNSTVHLQSLFCDRKSPVTFTSTVIKSLPTVSVVQAESKNANSSLDGGLQNNFKYFPAATNVPTKCQVSNSSVISSLQSQNSFKNQQSTDDIHPQTQDYTFNNANNVLTVELMSQNNDKLGNLSLFNGILNCSPETQRNVNTRFMLSLVFLKCAFMFTNFETALKACLHILNDARLHFCNSAPADQSNFIKECRHFFFVESNGIYITNMNMSCISNNERTLLFVVYLLSREGDMHYSRLSEMIVSSKFDGLYLLKKICDPFLKYFEDMNEYLTVFPTGFIRPNHLFDHINSIVEFHLNLTLKVPTSYCNVSTNKEGKHMPLNNVNKNVSSLVLTSNEIIMTEADMPVCIYKRLGCFLFYIKKYFNTLIANHILETFLYALPDIKTHFSNLFTIDRHRFIAQYFLLINDENVINIYLSDSELSTLCLTDDEKFILLVTYMLLKEKSLHFTGISKKLNELKVKCSLCTKSVSNQFKHFKVLNEYFFINSDGFVCLSSSFSSLSSIINSVSAFNPDIQKKLNSVIKIENKPESCPKEEKMLDTSPKSHMQNNIININACNKETKKNILISDKEVQNIGANGQEETKINSSIKNGAIKNSASNANSKEVIEDIVDGCFTVLSVHKRKQVEKLCNRLNSCGIKRIQNYFSTFTMSEKTDFFANMPQYFDVSKDGFVSLKEAAFTSYVPKTVISTSGAIKSISASGKAIGTEVSSRPESANSCRVSESSETHSCKSSSLTNKSSSGTTKRTRKKSKKNSREIRKFTIAPQALNRLKDFLNSGNSLKKFQNTWRNKCDDSENTSNSTSAGVSSQNDSVKAVYSASFPCQSVANKEFNFSETNSVKDPQKNKSDPFVFQFGASSRLGSGSKDQFEKSKEFVENKYSFNFSELDQALKTVTSYPKTENADSNLKLNYFSSSTFDYSDSPQDKESLKDSKKCPLKENAFGNTQSINENNKVLNGNTCNSSGNCDNDNIYSIDNFSDSYESYGTELLNSFLGELNPELLKNDSSYTDLNNVIELRAINFFCTILGNYDIGLNVDFLKDHLNLASAEVRSFMLNRFQKDSLSFFLKHKKAFYVSPQTNNVYLVRKEL